ncbi:hypothetical protein KM043_014580 [Ampulex compressa]|nr:hypothetical protein KM043_014580 [Ampulex compressa]
MMDTQDEPDFIPDFARFDPLFAFLERILKNLPSVELYAVEGFAFLVSYCWEFQTNIDLCVVRIPRKLDYRIASRWFEKEAVPMARHGECLKKTKGHKSVSRELKKDIELWEYIEKSRENGRIVKRNGIRIRPGVMTSGYSKSAKTLPREGTQRRAAT